MQPKVTIILPVYNVEPYLRQCLDSVVNQTMREIQIICINDGSTDGSPAILEEYAAQDPRIEVYHQENQGGGSARNAAYPHIRGKYAYFADPDDWLELDLCQQCWDKAEASESDCVVFQDISHNPDPVKTPFFAPVLPEIRQTPEEKRGIFKWIWRINAPWNKFWRSDFLLSNKIRFSEGKRPFNDMLHSWKGIALAQRIAILDSPLYHYRIRRDSYQHGRNETHFIIVETMNEVEKMFHETGFYSAYKEVIFEIKLASYYNWVCSGLPRTLQYRFHRHIHQNKTKTDREFRKYCRNALLLPSYPDKNRLNFVSRGIGSWLEIQRLHEEIQHRDAEIQHRDAEIHHRDAKIQQRDTEIHQRDAEIQRLHAELQLISNKYAIYWQYYRCKWLSKLTFGKKRKHYKEKRKKFHDKVRQIRMIRDREKRGQWQASAENCS